MQFRVYVCVVGGFGLFWPMQQNDDKTSWAAFWLAGRWSAVCFSFFWSSCLEKAAAAAASVNASKGKRDVPHALGKTTTTVFA